MLLCDKCNSQIEENHKFCPFCGSRLYKEILKENTLIESQTDIEKVDSIQEIKSQYSKKSNLRGRTNIILGIVIMSIVVLGFVSLTYNNNLKQHEYEMNKTKIYNNLISQVHLKKWDDANESLNKLNQYEDMKLVVKDIGSFITANKEYYSKNANELSISDLKGINNYLINISSNFKGGLTEDIEQFKEIINSSIKLSEQKEKEKGRIKAKQEQEKNSEIVKEFKTDIVSLIKLGNYKEAIDLYHTTINKKELMDDETNALSLYCLARLQASQEPKQYQTKINIMFKTGSILEKIPLSYNGILSSEIKVYKLSLADEKEWKDREEINSSVKQAVAEYESKTEPTIGMNAEQVRNSRWGSPKDINRTTTKFGISEQWVYSGNKYIYLEDGVVTAIQQ